MTNPTSNYGFVLPTSTDLVTDLPADFDVALQGVDTRLKALQPGTTLGDIAYSSATANTNTRLPIGTSGQVLAVSGGGVPAWTTTADVTPLTTKGDLFTFTTVDARIGVGANNTVLTADSAEATGLKWATPSGGLTLIKRSSFTTVTTTTTTFDNVFTSTYKAYKIVFETIAPNSGAVNLLFQYRVAAATQSGANYYTVSAGTNQAGTLQTLSDSAGTSAKIAPLQSGGYITLGEMLVTLVGGGSQGPMYAGDFYAQTAQTAFTCGGSYNAAIVADGFILSASSSTITGTVAVYGLGA